LRRIPVRCRTPGARGKNRGKKAFQKKIGCNKTLYRLIINRNKTLNLLVLPAFLPLIV
jgi:hypothetical protein